jgi:hypothetical protein
MAGSITSLSNNGIAAASQSLSRSGSDRQLSREVGDLGKHLAANDVAAAQSAVASLKNAAPTQNAGTDFSNAVKALDAALKANNTSGAAEAFANLQRAQKRIQQDRLTGPAQDVPNRPRVSGGSDFETVRAASPDTAPDRATGADTARLAKAVQADTRRAGAEQAFITRQDLAAKSAQSAPESTDSKPIGTTINTTA